MLLTDRVMFSETYDFRQRYDPSSNIEERDVIVDQPVDLVAVQNRNQEEQNTADQSRPIQRATE
jgi:hypothetical protein